MATRHDGGPGAMKRVEQMAPRRSCTCGHSRQWHVQTQQTFEAGAMSYDGAPCQFPGCPCRGAVWLHVERR